jgi:hypothetical protein
MFTEGTEQSRVYLRDKCTAIMDRIDILKTLLDPLPIMPASTETADSTESAAAPTESAAAPTESTAAPTESAEAPTESAATETPPTEELQSLSLIEDKTF